MTTLDRRNHGYMQGVHRLRLHYRTWELDRPKAALMVQHGLFEHSGRYAELAGTLATRGHSTFAFDMRGHGASEGRRGHVRRFDVLLQDLDRFRREVQGLVPIDTPLFLLGHSMGGLVALRYLQEYDPDVRGAIITSPWLGTAVPVSRWQRLAVGVLDRVLPSLPLPARIDPELLSHDQERVDDYRDDPTIHGTLTPRLFSETNSAMGQVMRKGDRINVPVLFLIAGDDRIVDAAKSRAFAETLQAPDITVEVLDDAYHEVLQERDRDRVMEEIGDWIESRLP